MKTKKTSTEKSAKNSGFRSLLPCAKGYRLPSFLTPIFIVLEVTMEVFIPLLMAAIVDGGLYGRTYGCGCKHGFCKEPAPKSF